VRADSAYWGKALVDFSVTVIGTHSIIPFDRKKQPLACASYLVYGLVSDLARAVIEHFFAAAKRYDCLDTRCRLGLDAALLHVALTFCAILLVALAADELNRPRLRLSPTLLLAHDLPVERAV